MTNGDDLIRAFGLGPEDLEANRRGALSTRQGRQLVRSGVRNVLASLVIAVILAAILLLVANRPLKPAQWITAGILALAALATGLYDLARTRAAAGEGRVECLAGPVDVQSRGRSGWHLAVAGRSFRMPVRPWHLQNGASYRVYVSARANRIVAMEPA